MAARMVTGTHRCDLEDLHWLPVSQQVVFKTALMVWNCIHSVAAAAYLIGMHLQRPRLVDRTCALRPLELYLFRALGLWGSEVSPSMDRPPGTVCRLDWRNAGLYDTSSALLAIVSFFH